MPVYGMPGVATTKQHARRYGVGAVVIVLVLALALIAAHRAPDPDRLRLSLKTVVLGDGVAAGTAVRTNGVSIGSVVDVESHPDLTQTITIAVDRHQLGSLTDSLDVRYAPSNLFGITDVVLISEPGGLPLTDRMRIDLTAAGRVADVTMGTLLRQLSDTTLTVLTPDLTKALAQLAESTRAFNPLLEAIVSVSRSVARTQQTDASFLVRQYAKFFTGVGAFGDGFIKMVFAITNIGVLRTDREKFDVGVSMVVDRLLPEVNKLLYSLDGAAGKYTTALVPLVHAIAQTVPEPERSHRELRELLARVDRTFASAPGGIVVSVDVALAGVPGVAQPLRRAARTGGGR